MTLSVVLWGLLGICLAGLFLSIYAFYIEPALRLRVRTWRIARGDWDAAPLRIAIL